MTNQPPHQPDEHEQVQLLVDNVNAWFEMPTGQAFKQVTEDRGLPTLVYHMLKDFATEDPTQIPQAVTTAFMIGAKFMREWMNERQAEPLPEEIQAMAMARKDKADDSP
jgi:hypothetical protein